MKNTKRNLISRVVGGVLCGVIGLTSFSAGANEIKIISNSQIVSSTEVSDSEKKSEQYYRTKTGKCYHKENCKCLKNSKVNIHQEEIKEADLKSCSKCCK